MSTRTNDPVTVQMPVAPNPIASEIWRDGGFITS